MTTMNWELILVSYSFGTPITISRKQEKTSQIFTPSVYMGFADLNFLGIKINLRGSTGPKCILVPWEAGACASLIFLGAVCLLYTKPGVKWFPQRVSNAIFLMLPNDQGKLNVKVWLNGSIPNILTLTHNNQFYKTITCLIWLTELYSCIKINIWCIDI